MKLFSAIYDTGMIRFLCQVPIEHNSVADFRSSEIYLFFCIEMFFFFFPLIRYSTGFGKKYLPQKGKTLVAVVSSN